MRTIRALCLGSALLWSAHAGAATVSDPTGDFATGYTGAAADLDVTSFSVNYNAVSQIFTLGATFAGVINPTTAGVYIIGVNTGTGPNAPFAGIGAPLVRFNQVLRVNKDGTGVLGTTALPVALAGNGFTVDVALSLLASTGFTPEQYGFNLWPRNGLGTGTFVTDFSPDNGMLSPGVPEPATWAMLTLGFGLVGYTLRRRDPGRVRYAPTGFTAG